MVSCTIQTNALDVREANNAFLDTLGTFKIISLPNVMYQKLLSIISSNILSLCISLTFITTKDPLHSVSDKN